MRVARLSSLASVEASALLNEPDTWIGPAKLSDWNAGLG